MHHLPEPWNARRSRRNLSIKQGWQSNHYHHPFSANRLARHPVSVLFSTAERSVLLLRAVGSLITPRVSRCYQDGDPRQVAHVWGWEGNPCTSPDWAPTGRPFPTPLSTPFSCQGLQDGSFCPEAPPRRCTLTLVLEELLELVTRVRLPGVTGFTNRGK